MPSTVGAGLSEGGEYFSFAKKRRKKSIPQRSTGASGGEGVDNDKIPQDFRAMNVDKLPRGPLC